jgi:hypothetical protein
MLFVKRLIAAIGSICATSFDLVRPDVLDIARTLLAVTQAAHFQVLLESFTALDAILRGLGPRKAARIPDLLSTLAALGGRVSKSKVHAAIFRLLSRSLPGRPGCRPDSAVCAARGRPGQLCRFLPDGGWQRPDRPGDIRTPG